jgi:hypothetical protein
MRVPPAGPGGIKNVERFGDACFPAQVGGRSAGR